MNYTYAKTCVEKNYKLNRFIKINIKSIIYI